MFDMLDDAALRKEQTLRYMGKIDVPVNGGNVEMDSYVQTGIGVLPTHYLVDDNGMVQLITSDAVNWVLTAHVKIDTTSYNLTVNSVQNKRCTVRRE